MKKKVRILVFTGDGKGKTTAALGMVLRAVGHNLRVGIVQFVKNNATVGEYVALAKLDVPVVQIGLGFLPSGMPMQIARHRGAAEGGLHQAAAMMESGQFDLLILDEICFAVYKGLLEEHLVLETLRRAPAGMRLVLTGRGATRGIMQAADTVTEMQKIKHGFDSGWAAQEGVEW